MNFLQSNQKSPPLLSSSPPPQFHLQQLFANLQNNCNGFFQNITNHFNAHLSNFAVSSTKSPLFARIPHLNETQIKTVQLRQGIEMSNEEIEQRLAGVPVYALTNGDEEFVLISDAKSGRSLGLFCFREQDADALLEQMTSMEPTMGHGSKVVPVALNKVFQLKVNGVAFRLIPEAAQIKNALKEKGRAGLEEFVGVPVFQSKSLILMSENERYRPVFFRQEDLENSLLKASRQQGRLNPAFRQGDIHVADLEDIIKGMKDGSCSTWDDVVFVPPGFEAATDPSQLKSSAK
uniref:Protein TIC 22-like, chloroplastic n=1 Tax=Opuntia streptacantha TaxID=393608 RepID=A0A7C8ZPM3_OPUST